jgi:hypothetical protein
MKPKTYTTKSVHTGIDESRSYVLMSEGLEQQVQLDERREPPKAALVKIEGLSLRLSFFSLEVSNDRSVILCVDCHENLDPIIDALLTGSLVSVTLAGKEFNSHVLKVESGRCYLRLSR